MKITMWGSVSSWWPHSIEVARDISTTRSILKSQGPQGHHYTRLEAVGTDSRIWSNGWARLRTSLLLLPLGSWVLKCQSCTRSHQADACQAEQSRWPREAHSHKVWWIKPTCLEHRLRHRPRTSITSLQGWVLTGMVSRVKDSEIGAVQRTSFHNIRTIRSNCHRSTAPM